LAIPRGIEAHLEVGRFPVPQSMLIEFNHSATARWENVVDGKYAGADI
jgi:hypothetical protein